MGLADIYPHHCTPDDVDALVLRLEALADPEKETVPSYENTDWRTLAGVTARVIKYLRGDDWRHGAPMGQAPAPPPALGETK